MSKRPARRTAPRPAPVPYRGRPFAGLRYEGDLIALREVVPSATAPLSLTGEHAGREVTVATVLPLAWPAMVRRDGSVVLALQCPARSGDLGVDLAQALLTALAADPGTGVTGLAAEVAGAPSLVDLVADEPWQVTIHPGFEWWITEADREAGLDRDVEDSLTRANAAVVPTARLTSVESAFWCRINERTHLRWAMPDDEERLLDGLARLHGDGGLALGEGTKYVGAFRAHGILMPVWDLRPGDEPADVEAPAAAFAERLTAAVAAREPLTGEQRRARSGLLSRQLTLR